jgi:uncharacterized membrane protein
MTALFLIPLTLAQSIEGRVVDLDGNSIPTASIRILGQQFESDSEGRFKASGIAPGVVSVEIRSRGFRQETVTVSLQPADRFRLTVGLGVGDLADHPAMRVDGTVRNLGGHPVPNITVTLRASFNPRVRIQSRTDAKGHYALSVSQPAQYQFACEAPDARTVLSTPPSGRCQAAVQ